MDQRELIDLLGSEDHREGMYIEGTYYWATLGIYLPGGQYRILDAWNCGSLTAQIIFPNKHTVQRYLASVWGVDFETVRSARYYEMDPTPKPSVAPFNLSPEVCGFQGDPVCNPPDCSGACPPGNDLRSTRPDPYSNTIRKVMNER